MLITSALRANNSVALEIESEEGIKTVFYWLFKKDRCHPIVVRDVITGVYGINVSIPVRVVSDGVIRESDEQYLVRVVESHCAKCGGITQSLEINL